MAKTTRTGMTARAYLTSQKPWFSRDEPLEITWRLTRPCRGERLIYAQEEQ